MDYCSTSGSPGSGSPCCRVDGAWGCPATREGLSQIPGRHQASFKEHEIISDELLKLCFLTQVRQGKTQPYLKSWLYVFLIQGFGDLICSALFRNLSLHSFHKRRMARGSGRNAAEVSQRVSVCMNVVGEAGDWILIHKAAGVLQIG